VPGVRTLVSNAVVSEDLVDRPPPSPNLTQVGTQKSMYLRFIIPIVVSTIPAYFLDSVREMGTLIEREFEDIH
jgi:hypothetical protein